MLRKTGGREVESKRIDTFCIEQRARYSVNQSRRRLIVMANQLGKRLQCNECGLEVLCTKEGEGTVQCCGNNMEIKKSASLPTAD